MNRKQAQVAVAQLHLSVTDKAGILLPVLSCGVRNVCLVVRILMFALLLLAPMSVRADTQDCCTGLRSALSSSPRLVNPADGTATVSNSNPTLIIQEQRYPALLYQLPDNLLHLKIEAQSLISQDHLALIPSLTVLDQNLRPISDQWLTAHTTAITPYQSSGLELSTTALPADIVPVALLIHANPKVAGQSSDKQTSPVRDASRYGSTRHFQPQQEDELVHSLTGTITLTVEMQELFSQSGQRQINQLQQGQGLVHELTQYYRQHIQTLIQHGEHESAIQAALKAREAGLDGGQLLLDSYQQSSY